MKTWEAREKELAVNILTKRQTVNEENMRALERQSEIGEMINADTSKPDEEKLSEKSLLSLLLEIMMDTGRSVREMHYDQVEARELDLAERRLERTPPPPPGLSENWNDRYFRSITEEEGRFIDLY
jgi:hypothetical protein